MEPVVVCVRVRLCVDDVVDVVVSVADGVAVLETVPEREGERVGLGDGLWDFDDVVEAERDEDEDSVAEAVLVCDKVKEALGVCV